MNKQFTQTDFWISFKTKHGWKSIKAPLPPSDSIKANEECIQVLFRPFLHNLFTIAYIPMAPSFNVASDNLAIDFSHTLFAIAKSLKPLLPSNTLFVRFDAALSFFDNDKRDEFNRGVALVSFADRLPLKKCTVDIQPPDTTILDLSKTEEELLASMKSKCRYNINLSKKKGVVVERFTGESKDLDEKLEIFYKIYQETAKRDGIALHEKEYYKDLLLTSAADKGFIPPCSSNGNTMDNALLSSPPSFDKQCVTLYLAKSEDDYLAAIITLFSSCVAVYLYGASSNQKRNLMPNFLLQWTAIMDAKKWGCATYDFYGIPPTDKEEHAMHGLYRFKVSFGGNLVHYVGSYDVKMNFLYPVLTAFERMRAWFHKTFLKKVRGR